MALYLISYDIADKDAFEYQPLWNKLKELKAVRILYSEWLLVDEVGASTDLWSKIAPLTSTKDKLLIQEVTNDARWDALMIPDAKFQKLLLEARG
jgi:hypothetical protein